MFKYNILSKSLRFCIHLNQRNFTVTVIGAAGGIGQPLAMLLKMHPLITRLALYDKQKMTPGVAKDLSHIPTSTLTDGWVGEENLKKALEKADIVVIPGGQPRKPGMSRDDLFVANANVIVETVKAMAPVCPKAFLAIITNPVNSLVPLACKLLDKQSVLDRRRVFGITTLDTIRAMAFYSAIVKADPKTVNVPMLCGHSDTTIIPVFSAATPKPTMDQSTIAAITERIRKAGTEVVQAKAGGGSATLSMAFAAHTFVDCLLQALNGATVTHCTYVANNDFGTEYFAGPVKITKEGAVEMERLPDMSKFETDLLEKSIKVLRKDIQKGEAFAK